MKVHVAYKPSCQRCTVPPVTDLGVCVTAPACLYYTAHTSSTLTYAAHYSNTKKLQPKQ